VGTKSKRNIARYKPNQIQKFIKNLMGKANLINLVLSQMRISYCRKGTTTDNLSQESFLAGSNRRMNRK
jgi:hypothetical protein